MTRLVRRLFFLGKVSPLLVVVRYTRNQVHAAKNQSDFIDNYIG